MWGCPSGLFTLKINPDHTVGAADHMQQNLPLHGLLSAESPFEFVSCDTNCILLWYCLRLATECGDSVASWAGFCSRPVSDAACDWSWAICLELQSDLKFLAALLGLCVQGNDQAVYQVWFLLALGPGSIQLKTQGTLRPASTCRWPVRFTTERTSVGTQVAWGRFLVSH